jgi:hypothetical protein
MAEKPNSLNIVVKIAQKNRKISYNFQLIFSNKYCIIKLSSIKYRFSPTKSAFASTDAWHQSERIRIFLDESKDRFPAGFEFCILLDCKKTKKERMSSFGLQCKKHQKHRIGSTRRLRKNRIGRSYASQYEGN